MTVGDREVTSTGRLHGLAETRQVLGRHGRDGYRRPGQVLGWVFPLISRTVEADPYQCDRGSLRGCWVLVPDWCECRSDDSDSRPVTPPPMDICDTQNMIDGIRPPKKAGMMGLAILGLSSTDLVHPSIPNDRIFLSPIETTMHGGTLQSVSTLFGRPGRSLDCVH